MHISSRCLRALALLALVPLAGCSEPAAEVAPPDPWVLVQPAAPPTDPARRALGTVRAAQFHALATETGGRVERLEVDVGDRVRRGQLLVVLDAAVASRRVAAAREELARADAQLAERDRHRTRVAGLVALGAASDADADQAEIERRAAASAVATARAELAAAQRELAAVEVRAPVDGLVAVRHVERSAVAAPGAPLLEIDGDGPREIVAVAPESIARDLQPGTSVEWRVGTTTGRAIVERIGRRAGGADARQLALRVIEGDAAPGSIAEVAFPDGAAPATARVPAAAVLTARDGSRTVRVVDADRRVRDVPVELVRLVAGGALVAGDLAPGAQVVAAGGQYATPGSRVQPRLASR